MLPPEIMGELTPKKKTQLQEVADGLLAVFRTLVLMQYLEEDWIQPGPHDISALLPVYKELNLDASIIYLYSILPYIDPVANGGLNFFQNGDFADFRRENDVRRGRDPMYADNEEEIMPSYMTPLSLLGNHGTVVWYNAKDHSIGMEDQESGGSTDHWLHRESSDEEDENGSEGGGDGGSDEEADDEDGDDDGGADMDEDWDEDDEGEDPHYWEEKDTRPAPKVLQDMVRWYHELIETPGGGEQTGPEWDSDLVEPLYEKHGWPGENFDAEAFLIDQSRAVAFKDAEWRAEHLTREVQKYESWAAVDGNEDDHTIRELRKKEGILAAAQTPEEEWLARWELFRAERIRNNNIHRLRKAQEDRDRACPGGVCMKPEDAPLWELREVQEHLWHAERSLKSEQETAEKHIREGRAATNADGLRQAVKHHAIMQKAYEASRADAERLCPGRSLASAPGTRITGMDYNSRLTECARGLEEARADMSAFQLWMDQIPQGIKEARKVVQDTIASYEKTVEHWEATRKANLEGLEKAKLKEGPLV